MQRMKVKKQKGKIRKTISISETALAHGRALAKNADRNFSNMMELLIKKEAHEAQLAGAK